MNTSFLTDMLIGIGNVSASPVSVKRTATQNTNQFAPAPADDPPYDDAPQTTTTDNTFAFAQSEPLDKPPQEFRHTLCKKTMAEQPQKAQDSPESKEPGPTSNVAEQPNVVQSWLEQYSQTVEHGKGRVATKIQPKAGYELAQLLANLKAGKSTLVTGQAAKSAEIKLLRTTDKGQLGLKTVSSETPKSPPATDGQPGEGKNVEKIQILNKILVATKGLTNQENGRELTAESVSGGKTATNSQKTPVLNDSFSAVQDKSTNLEQKILIGPEKSAPVAEKPTDSKADAGQQGHVLAESSDSNGKEQKGNLSGDSLLKNLNPAQFWTSANQTKDRGSSTSDNGSNSAFEQMLSANNDQTPIVEQTSAFSLAAKTADNPSPSDVYPSINEQIQASIGSSLRQGDQQITINLHPPELGRIFIRFQEQQDQITGLLEVEKIQTRYEIEQALPQIIENLRDSGIQIKRLEVMLPDTEQSEQEALKDQSLQNGWAQQQDSANPGLRGNNPDTGEINEWLTNNNSYQNISELREAFVTGSSINMLI